MPAHLHSKSLYTGALVTVRDVCCRPHGPECSGEEFSTRHEIVFPRSGVFVKHVRGESVVADANQVLFFHPHESHRVSHPVPGGDDCTVFTFRDDCLIDASQRFDPGVADQPQRVLPSTHAPNQARSVMLYQRIRSLGRANALQTEELALELLTAVLEGSYGSRPRGDDQARPATRRAHQSAVDATKTVMAARFRERLTLTDVAGEVHLSPFHLARLFRKFAGTPLHRYLNRLRLRAALEQLADGSQDLTGLAFDLGYSSHSHFNEAFRSEYGVAPGQFRRCLHGTACREMSKILKVARRGVA